MRSSLLPVRRHERFYNSHSPMGYVWYLDKYDRVRKILLNYARANGLFKLPQCLGVLVRRIPLSDTSTNHSIQGHIMSFSEFSKHRTMLSHKP